MAAVVLEDRYRVERLIGSGGFAQVFLGTDLTCDQPVAIKLMRMRWIGDRRVSDQFVNEARALRRLTHAPIAQLHADGETDDQRRYLVLDRLTGPLFGELLEAPLPVRALLSAFVELLDALCVIHRRGIVHGDLKASNVVLADATHPTLRLIDFGLARSLVDRRDRDAPRATWALGGTPEFMAPELSQGDVRSVASDIYATGAMLYELLTGEPPFRGGTSVELANRHELEVVPPLSTATAVPLPIGFDALVVRAMAKRPADRFASMASFRTELVTLVRASDTLDVLRPACQRTGDSRTWRHGHPVSDDEDRFEDRITRG